MSNSSKVTDILHIYLYIFSEVWFLCVYITEILKIIFPENRIVHGLLLAILESVTSFN